MQIRASCTCTAPIMVRGGAVVCASCSAAVVAVAPLAKCDPDRYGSRAPYEPCPGHSHRWSRDNIPRMPGAKREGGVRGRGVFWTIARADYEAWLASLPTVDSEPSAAPVVDFAAWTAYAGLRLTRSI